MFTPALSRDEKELLSEYFGTSPVKLIRLKAQAMLMVDEGLKYDQIGRLVLRKERTIQLWVHQFKNQRLASLFSGHIYNENASKLTKAQKAEIADQLERPPDEYGLPKKFWDVPQLKEYVKAEFGVVYESSASYHYMLKFSGLSFKYPDKLSPRRNEPLIKERMSQIRKEIQPYLSDKGWVILACDETRVQLEAEIRRAWLKRGERTVVKTERSKEHQNYLGFLNQQTGKCQVFDIEKGNQVEMIRVLQELVKQYPGKRICVVWDNARYHKGKLLRDELRKGRSLERIHLINFPPYAPECNPIEHVWAYGKSEIANMQEGRFEITKATFLSAINQRIFDYKI